MKQIDINQILHEHCLNWSESVMIKKINRNYTKMKHLEYNQKLVQRLEKKLKLNVIYISPNRFFF